MSCSIADVDKLASKLHLGKGHEDQERAVRGALCSLLVHERRGVVLADEVGCGKTYEALGIMALLADRARIERTSFERVLILCRPALLQKWQEEVSGSGPDHGFPQYLVGVHWPKSHPIFPLIKQVSVITSRAAADGHKSMREGGILQAKPGIYIVNERLLGENQRGTRPFLERLYKTAWDLVIVDEAHHYAKGNRPSRIFAPDGDLKNSGQGLLHSNSAKILALTATPFELMPGQIVQLLALIRADEQMLGEVEKGLALYVDKLNTLFSIRNRSPEDTLRRDLVRDLGRLRNDDASDTGRKHMGLQALLRRYMIRNTKGQNERRYLLVNKVNGQYQMRPFEKLDNLRTCLEESPLLPFDGADALFYLELRELIQATIQQAREGTGTRTFITTDLRQGLSSYPQIAGSKLLDRDLESAHRLRRLVRGWNSEKGRHLHPKVQALADLVTQIAEAEIEKVKKNPTTWFSKILVFNKLINGTAPHLRAVLTSRLDPLFDRALEEHITARGWPSREKLAPELRKHIAEALADSKKSLSAGKGNACAIPAGFTHDDFRSHHGHHLIDAYRGTLVQRPEQALFLFHCVRTAPGPASSDLRRWVNEKLVQPLEESLRKIIDDYLDDAPRHERPEDELVEMAERECVRLLDEHQSVELVGRFDGANLKHREAHRRNFNAPFNPFVLLVSRVGEEGIDLQKQCRYVIHYDLEWNPAKMEQREGRVDRVGWGRADEGFIDVRFMLLKGTYEERIFHAVMQREQWFQVLIGSKRTEMGGVDTEKQLLLDKDSDEEVIDDTQSAGSLTLAEKTAVMMDLRP